MYWQKEEYIEADILEYLTLHGVSCEKIVTEWYFDTNRGFYRTRKSRFVKKWSADIQGTIAPDGRALYIEVKKPSEMAFFDRSVQDITEAMLASSAVNKRKYVHAIEQREYLDEKLKCWAVAFFASSVKQVQERLVEQGIFIS